MEIAKPFWKVATKKILMKIEGGVHRDLQTRKLLPPLWETVTETHGSFQHGEAWSPEPPLVATIWAAPASLGGWQGGTFLPQLLPISFV